MTLENLQISQWTEVITLNKNTRLNKTYLQVPLVKVSAKNFNETDVYYQARPCDIESCLSQLTN